jgi:hypothetical protein
MKPKEELMIEGDQKASAHDAHDDTVVDDTWLE